jgi:fibro-slime domain-containing protein
MIRAYSKETIHYTIGHNNEIETDFIQKRFVNKTLFLFLIMVKKEKQMNLAKALVAVTLALGVSSSWANLIREDSTACSPTIHLKLPDGWRSAYITFGESVYEFPKADSEGWTKISFADTNAVGSKNTTKFFINNNTSRSCGDRSCIVPDGVNRSYFRNYFTCETFKKDNAEVWLMEHPDFDKQGQLYMSDKKPQIHEFHVFVPKTQAWFATAPVIEENGKIHEMLINENACGWYTRRYIDEAIPNEVLIYREDDITKSEPIGMFRNEATTAEAIPLSNLFALFEKNVLYFVADEEEASKLPSDMRGWYTALPPAEGLCFYELATTIYDTDASLHGAFSCTPNWSIQTETSGFDKNACYYSTAKFPMTTSADSAIPCLGVTSSMVEPTLDPETKKMKLTEKGKTCFGSQADEAFAALFKATPNVNESYCFYLPLSKNIYGKFSFDSDAYQSEGTKVLGGLYPAEQSPKDSYMTSERLPAAENKRQAEGPVYFCSDSFNNPQKPKGLRTIDSTEKVPVVNLICNGPGWDKGVDCEKAFVKGSELDLENSPNGFGKKVSETFGINWMGDGWGWSCPSEAPIGWPMYIDNTEQRSMSQSGSPRWFSSEKVENSDGVVLTNAGRNQHFCLETHATFKYRKGLNFSIMGNDDIWVFIDNKLAVDVGGSHMPAPGYVDLDKFLTNAKQGESYEIDIYYCNRRTPKTSFQITTNMYLEQPKNSRLPQGQGGICGAEYSRTGIAAKPHIFNNVSTFNVTNTGARELAIFTSKYSKAKQFAIMDMKGQVISTGALNNSETHVKVPTIGSYIVKVGNSYKRINVK